MNVDRLRELSNLLRSLSPDCDYDMTDFTKCALNYAARNEKFNALGLVLWADPDFDNGLVPTIEHEDHVNPFMAAEIFFDITGGDVLDLFTGPSTDLPEDTADKIDDFLTIGGY